MVFLFAFDEFARPPNDSILNTFGRDTTLKPGTYRLSTNPQLSRDAGRLSVVATEEFSQLGVSHHCFANLRQCQRDRVLQILYTTIHLL